MKQEFGSAFEKRSYQVSMGNIGKYQFRSWLLTLTFLDEWEKLKCGCFGPLKSEASGHLFQRPLKTKLTKTNKQAQTKLVKLAGNQSKDVHVYTQDRGLYVTGFCQLNKTFSALSKFASTSPWKWNLNATDKLRWNTSPRHPWIPGTTDTYLQTFFAIQKLFNHCTPWQTHHVQFSSKILIQWLTVSLLYLNIVKSAGKIIPQC